MESLVLRPVLKPDTTKLAEAYEVTHDVKRTICGVTIHVPKFFQYDGASIPAVAWQIIGTPFNPRFMIASVFHDWLYHTHQVPRAAADKLHYDLLMEDGVARWKASAMNYAVRQLGGSLMMSRPFMLTRAGFDPGRAEGDAVLSTGAAVTRSDWDTTFSEVLDMSAGSVRLGRLRAGGPLLNSHRYHDGVDAMLGSIMPGTARIDAGKLLARVKLSVNCPLGQRIARDIADGHAFSFSLGYRVYKYAEERSATAITRTAIDWEPLEASIVTIPAEGEGTGFLTAA